MESAAMDDLAWLGIDWDEGPDRVGAYGPYRQSERTDHYESALRQLHRSGRVFPCRLSRKDLQNLATAPHGGTEAPYPRDLRPTDLPSDWFDNLEVCRDAAVRFMVRPTPVTFIDRVSGPYSENVSATVGDFVLRRRDNVYAYQLAVVVDDLAMRISEVVRGRDLLDSTARQIQLIEALSGHPPTYAHVPLVRNEWGDKLSKRDEALTISSLREAGARPELVVGLMAWSLGLRDTPEPVAARALVRDFSWQRVTKEDWILPADFIDRCLRGN